MMLGKKEESVSVAWYKLADLIARGEREKALNVYRLLAHSFDDKAYALQLEGDILWSFDENVRAGEKYRQAAVLYKKEERWINAIAVCRHFLAVDPQDTQLLSLLIYCYAVVDWQEKFIAYLPEFLGQLKQSKEHEGLLADLIENLRHLCAMPPALGDKTWLSKALLEGVREQQAWIAAPILAHFP